MQAARRMDRPRPRRVIGVGQTNVAAFVVGEIEVVIAEPIADPVGHPDHRRTLDIDPYGRMEIGRNDWPIEQAPDAHADTSSYDTGPRRAFRIVRAAGGGRLDPPPAAR
jgi:hypothetical protein